MSNAIFEVPIVVNEPVLTYAPGSVERAEVKAMLSELKSKRLKVIEEKLVRPMGLIRHDSDTLARIICKL